LRKKELNQVKIEDNLPKLKRALVFFFRQQYIRLFIMRLLCHNSENFLHLIIRNFFENKNKLSFDIRNEKRQAQNFQNEILVKIFQKNYNEQLDSSFLQKEQGR